MKPEQFKMPAWALPRRTTRFRNGQKVTWDFGSGQGQVALVFPSGGMEVHGKDPNSQRVIRLYDNDGVLMGRHKTNQDLTLDDPEEADMMDMI